MTEEEIQELKQSLLQMYTKKEVEQITSKGSLYNKQRKESEQVKFFQISGKAPSINYSKDSAMPMVTLSDVDEKDRDESVNFNKMFDDYKKFKGEEGAGSHYH